MSKQYEIMCKKAVEIQEKWEPKPRDFYLFNGKIEVLLWIQSPGLIFRYGNYDQFGKPRKKFNTTWLPTQEQLQGMVLPKIRESHKNTYAFVKGDNPEGFIAACLLVMFNIWTNEANNGKNYKVGNSMNELWLAFVMHELYQKKWNGERWINERI